MKFSCRFLTLDLQVYMILRDPKHVSGHTGVFATITCLSTMNLQCAIVMNSVRVSIEGAGSSVFKPATDSSLVNV